MTTRTLITSLLALALGALPLLAQQPGDPDYDPDNELFEEWELLGDSADSEYEFDEEGFDAAAGRTAAAAPEVTPPSGDEVKEFRAGLEAHWGGNLPALLAYLQSIDPAAGDNPEPPEEGGSAHWAPDDDYDENGVLIESAEEERARWRRRVEQKLAQMAAQ